MELRTGTPAFAFDDDLTVVSWNEAAEQLTGIPADEAVGSPCWALLAGVDDHGSLVCHQGCANARLAREGFPVPPRDLLVRGAEGRVRVSTTTVSVGNGLHVHVLGPAGGRPARIYNSARLTRRQLEVLHLLDRGLGAAAICEELGVSMPTVRTHIRVILRELGAHSQVEALAAARAAGLV